MPDIYAQRGYGAQLQGFGTKAAVVVVDFQRGFIDSTFPMGGAPMVDAAVNRTVPLVKRRNALDCQSLPASMAITAHAPRRTGRCPRCWICSRDRSRWNWIHALQRRDRTLC